MTEDTIRVGVIGLGAMGRPMTRRLLAGHQVSITGRGGPSRYAELVDAGARWCATPRELAAQTDVALLMLPDLPQTDEILDGPDGVLAAEPADLVLVVGSTSSPVGVRALAERVDTQTNGQVRVVDAPVSGGVEGAEAGTLSIMVGGTDPDVARVLPVLQAYGRPVHLGPLGAGEVAKACNQLIVAATILALGEAAVLADRSGLDVPALFTLLEGGYADSRLLRTRGRSLAAEDYTPAGAARYLVKDLGFGTDVAETTNTDPILLPALRAAFEDLVAQGLGDRDMAVTRRYIAERTP